MVYIVEFFLDKKCGIFGSGFEIGIFLGYIVVLVIVIILMLLLIDE